MPIIEKFNAEQVNNIYPEASMIPPMKIWSLPKNKKDKLKELCDSKDYLASLKIDGYFYALNRTENHVYLFSRNAGVNGLLTEKIDNMPHLKEAALRLPKDTLLCGEVFVPGGTSKDVTRFMGCLADKAVERQNKEGQLCYYINDVITCNGEDVRDLPFEDRAEIIKDIYRDFLSDYNFISVANNFDENIYETAMQLIANGEEGVVLKKKDSLYIADKRPAWSSIKIKAEDTLDVVITGFENPTKEYRGTEIETWPYWIIENRNPLDWTLFKKIEIGAPKEEIKSPDFRTIPVTKHYYYGWKNAIRIGVYTDKKEIINIGTISSGLTDEMRREFAVNPQEYINKVIEVKCMSVDKKEKTIRHGFFLKFRDDKEPESCLESDIF